VHPHLHAAFDAAVRGMAADGVPHTPRTWALVVQCTALAAGAAAEAGAGPAHALAAADAAPLAELLDAGPPGTSPAPAVEGLLALARGTRRLAFADSLVQLVQARLVAAAAQAGASGGGAATAIRSPAPTPPPSTDSGNVSSGNAAPLSAAASAMWRDAEADVLAVFRRHWKICERHSLRQPVQPQPG
jgi:hypothetical protein